MDNNFVNIDDLVRQRLGGGEEQERSGAWLHMRDLLDKEMPQERRAGFIYWRRMLSAVAVLLLIATISVGGYELSESRNGNKTDNTDVALTAAPARTTNAPVKNNEVNNTQISSSGVADNKQFQNDRQDSKKLIAANDNQYKNKLNNKPSATTITHKTVNSSEAIQNQLQITGKSINSKENDDAPVAKNTPSKNTASKEDVGGKEAATTKEPVKTSAPVAKAQNNVKTVPAGEVVASAAKHSKVIQENNSKATKMVAPVISSDKADDKEVAGINKVTAHKTNTSKIKENKIKEEKMEALALSSHLSAVSSPKINTVSKPLAEAPAVKTVNAKVVSSNVAAPRKKSIAATNAGKVIASKEATAKKEKPASEKVANATTSPSTDKDGKGLAANTPKNTPATKVAVATADNSAMKNAFAINTKKGKKIIQKLVLYEHHIKTDPSDEHYNLDTISMETLTEELGGEDNPYIPCVKKSSSREEPTNATARTNNEIAGTASSTNPQILPGASASASGTPAMGSKENTTSKQSAGGAALEGLSSAFNDIKYKVHGAQFAPGLTAGINGTFFGPSSFKGFEFGVTGDFIFGNDWTFSSELKYFHRINNSYSLNDNYYSYTQQGNVWSRQQMTNIYSFSTLHSIEMPLIVRYSFGKFNCYVGGNLVYTFSINEGGPQPLTVAPPPTTVAAPGNDETPKLGASDFNSRFGFGCLFGVSYKVAPNVTLDLRNVQTLWDNANSSGAKYISDQLYKSPSIQLSLGYRLGGHKAKD